MRSILRYLALGLAGVMLAACGHKDRNAPLAFVPADTPYVVANLEVMDDDTRKAMLAQADAQLPAQLIQMDAAADDLAAKDPDGARLLRAFSAEFRGKTVEGFAQAVGLDLKGYSAFYGLGMSPVMRFQLTDPSTFEGFISRLETAYGKKLEVASVDRQSYRRYAFADSGTQTILALVDQQAVAALLPDDAAPAQLRQALGLDRPKDNLQDNDRLAALAKSKGYRKWLVGELDLTRVLSLAMSGKDPLIASIRKAQAQAKSTKAGEPLTDPLQTSPSCATDAARIAARVPAISFGYTRLDTRHQELRVDVSLANDISQAIAGLEVALPGLGAAGSAPFELSMALPVAQLRTFWLAQAEAVATNPFACPWLSDLNDSFARLGPVMEKAAIPPLGDMLGLRIALDSLVSEPSSSLPAFSGRVVLATNNPAGLLAMGQMMVPALAQLRLGTDGKPQPLAQDMAKMLGQPAWVAMNDKALALGVGAGEDALLADTLKDPTGSAGQITRVHLSGAMYLNWLEMMEQAVDRLASATAAMDGGDEPSIDAADGNSAARTKAQFAAMKAQAAQLESIDAQMHMDSGGMVISSQTELK